MTQWEEWEESARSWNWRIRPHSLHKQNSNFGYLLKILKKPRFWQPHILLQDPFPLEFIEIHDRFRLFHKTTTSLSLLVDWCDESKNGLEYQSIDNRVHSKRARLSIDWCDWTPKIKSSIGRPISEYELDYEMAENQPLDHMTPPRLSSTTSWGSEKRTWVCTVVKNDPAFHLLWWHFDENWSVFLLRFTGPQAYLLICLSDRRSALTVKTVGNAKQRDCSTRQTDDLAVSFRSNVQFSKTCVRRLIDSAMLRMCAVCVWYVRTCCLNVLPSLRHWTTQF